jgi:hypothetical protein
MLKKIVFIVLIALAFCSINLVSDYSINSVSAQSNIITLRGEITKSMTLTPANRYVLEGGVFVRAGATLKIKAGTQIFAGPRSFLVVDRGAKIMAKGRSNKPIIFTSAQDAGNRRRGDWGGIIINGFAPINNGDSRGEADGEGNTGKYGGNNPDDSSGMLRYCRIEFAGFPLSPTNELNGLALQGVGRKTEIDYLQITESGDDAIEFFGGTVNVKHLLLYGSMDDAFDWTGGWQGKAQFVLVQQDGSIESNNGIEADNNSENNDLTPRSNPTIHNITLVGDSSTKTASSIGMLLRVGTGATIRNFIVQNYKDFGVRVKDQSTLNQLNSGGLVLESGVIFDNKKGVSDFQNNDGSNAGDLSGIFRNVVTQDPQLVDGLNKNNPNFRPKVGSIALSSSMVTPTTDPFFEKVNFLGGIGPNDSDDWTKGWTSFVRK